MNNSYKTAIGMMSGTSADGIDACLVKIYNDLKFEFIAGHALDYPEEIREKLLNIANNNGKTEDICYMDFAVGKLFAKCANELIEKTGISQSDVDFIASHGQTVFHHPTPVNCAGISTGSTLQIGNISVIAENTGVTTVGNFRTRDIAAGGQGAPLVPFADELIFGRKIPRCIQNIGGIANVTVLSPECKTFAFDTGPGNMLIDYCMKKYFDIPYDKDGRIACSGVIDEDWLEMLLKEPYYALNPPKTTGRELFNDLYAERILQNAPLNKCDIIATISALSAKTIFDAYNRFVLPKTGIKEIVIGGGGAYNKFLTGLLKKYFGHIPVKTHADFNINDKFKEAISFALLGYCTINKIPNNLPICTGAAKRVVMGEIAY